ncbi:PREDICTED: CLAVATA3/ESR (CLE)-related protein 10-like [Camelina sativa]|uniref:CLAVATA3/ESR (CLE)-related protein 10-like n=1 Tax=Camelina sativa TaxID=90675 RepID=A0ABM0WGV5_CAMSA|nr:PREDICTED: CLAVATA3/ESR (CLE)-related protein 10-like [Camelina sativa]
MMINRHRPINILIIIVFLLTTTARAGGNWSNRTHRTVPRVQHAYYAYPHRSCESFSRPYARTMCIELERIHRSSRQPLFSSPPPPSEIDQRYGVEKRLVPSGPNPLHN